MLNVKKKVAFYLKRFLSGGIESTLVQYLNHIDMNLYEVSLIVGFETLPHAALLEQISSHVKIIHVVACDFLSITTSSAPKKSNKFLHKALYQIITRPLSKVYLHYKRIQLLREFDCVVDYGLTLGNSIKKIPGKVVGYFHFRLSHHYIANKVTKRFHRVLPNYDHLVVINQQMLHDAESIFPECIGKFVLIYNQFNFATILERSEQNFENDQLMNQKFILSSGRLIETQKDFTSLINAYNCLKNNYSRQEKLYIIGDGPDRDKLQVLIQNLGLQNDVFLIGYQKNPFIWIKHAQCFVLSSKHEGLPSVLIEAMALNIPVVSTNCPDGPNEILLGGEAGALVEVSDIEGLSVAMNRVLSDADYANKIKQVSAQHLNRFNIEYNIHKLYQIFNG